MSDTQIAQPAADLAAIAAYQRVIAAGFARPTGAASNDLGALYATCIILAHPDIDAAQLFHQWTTAHDPHQLTGWIPAYALGSTDPTFVRANTAVIQTEVTGLGGDISTGLAKGAGEGVAGAEAVVTATGQGLQSVTNAFSLPDLLGKLGEPTFWLHVAYVVGGSVIILVALADLIKVPAPVGAVAKTVAKAVK